MVNMQVYDQIRAGLLHCRQGEDRPSSIVGAMACPRPVTPSTDGNPSSIVGAMACPRPVTPSTDEYPSSIVGAMACPRPGWLVLDGLSSPCLSARLRGALRITHPAGRSPTGEHPGWLVYLWIIASLFLCKPPGVI